MQGLEKLCTSAVTDMSGMFSSCDSLASLDLSSWDTSKVTNMLNMFGACGSLASLDLSGWDTSSVTNMSWLFRLCERLVSLDLSGWDTAKVTSMKLMFDDCGSLASLDLTGWNTSNVTDMTYMFSECKSLTNIDGIAGWDTSSVTNMVWLFAGCQRLVSLDLTGWNTSNVTDMTEMFRECYSLASLDLTSWNTSKVTNMSDTFAGCQCLASLDLTGWNTSNVTDMSGMFSYCGSLASLDLSGWDTSNVTDMTYMFSGCSSLETIYASDRWSTECVTKSDKMFDGCTSLRGEIPYDSTKTTVAYANYDTGYLTALPRRMMAANSNWYKSSTPKASITEIELVDRYTQTGEETESWDASAAGDGSVMAYLNGTKLTLAGNGTGKIYANPDARGYFTGFDRVTSIQGLEKLCTSAVIDMSDMFSYCDSLASLDLTGWNTSNVTNMTAMFSSCYSLINLDLSSWDTSNVTDMSGMFDGCERLVSLDLSSWNTSKVTNMSDTFLGCQCLVSLDLSSWNTSKVTDMTYMFSECKSLTNIDGIAGWNTSSVTNMSWLFRECKSLTSLDLTGWNTSNVTNMTAMFSSCYSLINLDLSSWDTSNVTDMSGMFDGCERLVSLDLSSWNTSKVTNMSGTFWGCSSLETIYASESWSTASVTESDNMFYGCGSLCGAIPFDRTKTTADYANYNTGYLTNINGFQMSYEYWRPQYADDWSISIIRPDKTYSGTPGDGSFIVGNSPQDQKTLSAWFAANRPDRMSFTGMVNEDGTCTIEIKCYKGTTEITPYFSGMDSISALVNEDGTVSCHWGNMTPLPDEFETEMGSGAVNEDGSIVYTEIRFYYEDAALDMSYEYWDPEPFPDTSADAIYQRPDKTYSGTPGDGSFIVGNSPQDQKTLSTWFAANRPDRMSFTGMVNDDGSCTIEIKCYKGTTEITPYFSGMDSISAVLNEDGTVSCHWGNMTPLPDEFKTAILGTCCNDGSVAYTEIRFYYDGQGSAQSVMAAAAPEGAEQIIAPAGEEPGNGSSADAVTEIEPTTEETQEDTQEDTASADGKDEQTAEPPDEGGSTAGIILTLALPAAWKGVLYGKTK